jgi:hypothetical protein
LPIFPVRTFLSLSPAWAALPEGVTFVRYSLRCGDTPGIHPWALEFEAKVICDEAGVVIVGETSFLPPKPAGQEGGVGVLEQQEVPPLPARLHHRKCGHHGAGGHGFQRPHELCRGQGLLPQPLLLRAAEREAA